MRILKLVKRMGVLKSVDLSYHTCRQDLDNMRLLT